MAVNVEVVKTQSESTANLVRRFTKRMQGAGIVSRMRGERYHARVKSRNVNKTKRLKALKKKDIYEEQLKLGKVVERTGRRK